MADDPNQNPDQTSTPPTEELPKPEKNTESPSQEITQPPTETPPLETTNPAASETPKTNVTNPTDTNTPIQEPKQTPSSAVSIPQLHYPFSGNFAVTFSFGAQSDNEEIKKKFTEWGITGHNGLDFGLTEGTEVFPCDNGEVLQSGENGDFGNSITIEHSWGQSLYAHLKETKINVGETAEVNKVIGLSGKTGAAFGEHLHFAIKPNNPDVNNGYLGFIDPSPYLSLSSQKEETKQEEPKLEETQQAESPQPPQTESTPSETVPPPIKLEPEKSVEQSEPPQTPQNPQVPQMSEEEIQKQVDDKLKIELDTKRQKANQARQTKREENLMKTEKLIEKNKQINNDDVRELLHVSQSTATEYLQTLVSRGTIKTKGKGKATIYHY